MKIKNILKDIARGAAIGTACIVPGVSGGTIAIMLKIYDKIIGAVADFGKHFVKSLLTLLPIGIGVILALLALWIPLNLAFEHLMFAIVSLFAGFIIGGIPSLVDEVKSEKVKPTYIIALVISMLIVAFVGVASSLFGLDVSSMFVSPYPIYLYFILIPVGAIVAMALIVPGISGSMLLLVLGFYKPILGLVDQLKDGGNIWEILLVLLCLVIGVLIGAILCSLTMKKLLEKHKSITMYAIIGFVIGSIFSMFYNFEIVEYYQNVLLWEWTVAPILLVVGTTLSYLLVVFERKNALKIKEKGE